MKNGFIYGLLAGMLYLIWVTLGSGAFPNLVFGTLSSITISSILIIIFMFLACQKEKNLLDGSIRFGEAFLTCLMAYFIFNLTYTIGFKFFLEFSPSAMSSFMEVSKAGTTDLLNKMGAGEDEIFQAVDDLEEKFIVMFSWKIIILNVIGGLVFPGAVLALIVAAITSKFPKKQP